MPFQSLGRGGGKRNRRGPVERGTENDGQPSDRNIA